MPKSLDPAFQSFLQKRLIATLATKNADGTIYLTAVWYLFEGGKFYVATSSQSRKARNAAARPDASLMVDSRSPGKERGVIAIGKVTVISGAQAREINRRVQSRYLSPGALSDPQVIGVFDAIDDVTLQLSPVSWSTWDMGALDAQLFGGRLSAHPEYFLPLD